MPSEARRDEVIAIRALIAHPMETGMRPGADGRTQARNIIRRFSCVYRDQEVFSAELFPSVSANPYLNFFLRVSESGVVRLVWEGDNGFRHVETRPITVSD